MATSKSTTVKKATPAKALVKTESAFNSFVTQALTEGHPETPVQSGLRIQQWEFTLDDMHRNTPGEMVKVFLSALEIPVYKHLQRLRYAAQWGLDPGYVLVQ